MDQNMSVDESAARATTIEATSVAQREAEAEQYEPLDRAEELAWLASHREQIARFAGRWIALVGHEVVAVSDSLAGVRELAREGGYPDPLLVPVPPPGATFR